jgi:hypothetical protein
MLLHDYLSPEMMLVAIQKQLNISMKILLVLPNAAKKPRWPWVTLCGDYVSRADWLSNAEYKGGSCSKWLPGPPNDLNCCNRRTFYFLLVTVLLGGLAANIAGGRSALPHSLLKASRARRSGQTVSAEEASPKAGSLRLPALAR